MSEVDRGEFLISFLRRKSQIKFVFPDQEDISAVAENDIVFSLKKTEVRTNQYFFELGEIKRIENLV